MNDSAALIIASLTTPTFAYDTYRRFLEMFGTVVLGVDPNSYRKIYADMKNKSQSSGIGMPIEDLKCIVEEFKKVADIPQDPWQVIFILFSVLFLLLHHSLFLQASVRNGNSCRVSFLV